ncbi:MAG: tRNA lysidine(34) synthetase TilS [Bacteroidales bacterium]|nr:tRNA lysidine(34) synthetase TilS [Bacteroidales bacterium]
MLQRLLGYLDEQHLLPDGQRVLLAVSGGRDSVCLAHLFHSAAIPFAIAHCNFHLRPGDCDRDQQFVARLADDYGVPFHTTSFDTHSWATNHHQGIEEAARTLRYAFFADLCRKEGYPLVATAHHADDAIETFFLNLFRGTGLHGLHGIQPRTTLATEHVPLTVIRPMLCFTRADIDAYVESHHLAYVEDSTNSDISLRRNWLRHRLLPLLREQYPSLDGTMLSTIAHLRHAEELFNQHIDLLRSTYLTPYHSAVPTLPFAIVSVDVEALPEPRTTVLYELLQPYGFSSPRVDDMLQPHPSGSLFFSSTHVAEWHRGRLLLAPRCEPIPPTVFDDDGGRLHLRRWRSGDRFRPKGMNGSRLVADYLKDRHISRIEREHVWLVVDDDDRICALLGLRDASKTQK